MKKTENTKSKILYKKKFFLLVILTVFVFGGLVIFRFGRGEQRQEFPLQVVNEAILTGNCTETTDCVLTLLSPNGATKELENVFSFKKDTPVYLLPNGKTLVYLSENEGVGIVDILNKRRILIPNTQQAKLLQRYSDSFWIDNENQVELYDLEGKQKVSIKKNLLPNYEESKDFRPPSLSPLYSNKKILAITGAKGEGFSTTTLWEVFSEKRSTKLKSKDTFMNACGDEECVSNEIYFLNTQAGYLVIVNHNDRSTSWTEVYKLFPDASRESFALNELVNSSLSPWDGVILSNDDNKLYYVQNGVINAGDGISNSRNFIYEYNLESGKLKTILEFELPSGGSNYFSPLTLSPTGSYMLLNDSRPDEKDIRHNFYTILVINDGELKSNLDPLLEGKKIIGWVNTED
ncbi:hypothetical protein A3D01_03680 [Candidatus Woesebacteria bacterium RIFCSPHIGHO2_02_FULL_39_13]|uniref:Uncharacterized protein n=1 Tax=Candidatus Woesebacteria bacterium RIFCSPHIGHO2_02_FULL_39_13 TaxID=1802505 RepID=A0A1F7Z5H7_9BACT|nr:MAG: hypothetical protein A3D01_03680 [Candidatus Woesebacteria bacterium RIFCSPHIGHO2_02_FULL_39_13]OGM38263.1 MAG: hypothetical protein A3E13_05790 [Candidatus Woesebacteria bacterium RIFCSPHIGHO2_12_FULL_40_20]